MYFAPSVSGLVGFWSSKSQSKDVSPVHVAGEGRWLTASSLPKEGSHSTEVGQI